MVGRTPQSAFMSAGFPWLARPPGTGGARDGAARSEAGWGPPRGVAPRLAPREPAPVEAVEARGRLVRASAGSKAFVTQESRRKRAEANGLPCAHWAVPATVRAGPPAGLSAGPPAWSPRRVGARAARQRRTRSERRPLPCPRARPQTLVPPSGSLRPQTSPLLGAAACLAGVSGRFRWRRPSFSVRFPGRRAVVWPPPRGRRPGRAAGPSAGSRVTGRSRPLCPLLARSPGRLPSLISLGRFQIIRRCCLLSCYTSQPLCFLTK